MGLRSLVVTILGLALGAALPAAAVTVVSCKDKDGTTFFADRCPPGTAKMGEKQVRSGPRRDLAAELAEVAKANPVVFFTVPDCDACDLVRQQLKRRNIPYTEKDVGPDNLENQQALKATANGNTTVPTVAIGARTFSGYSRAALDLGLDEAGYPPRATAPAAAAAGSPPASEVDATGDAGSPVPN